MSFGKILTAMVTPFNEHGELDLDRTTQLVEHLMNNGSDGLVVCGTTGESPTLTFEEKIKLIKHVVEVVDKKIPVLAGTGSNNTSETVQLTKEVESLGVDGIMLVAPYYNKPSQQGLYEHFKTVAQSTTLPIMLYNIPGRSVVNMSVETTVELSKIPNIVSIKDATGNLDMMSQIIEKTDENFSLYSGDDGLTLPALSVGATGVVSVASHIIGNEMQNMINAFEQGHVKESASLHRKLLPKMNACFMAPSPAPVKAALNHLGVQVGSVRLPLVPLTDEEKNSLITQLNI